MTEDAKTGCGCVTTVALIAVVYVIIHKIAPGLDFMQMTGFAWVPSLIIFAVVHMFFEEMLPTTKSEKELEERKKWAEKEKARRRAEEEAHRKQAQEAEVRRRKEQERKKREAEEKAKQQAEAAKKSEERFLRYLFSMLAKLAKADGRVDPEEVKTAEKVFERFEFALRRRQFCSTVFNTAKDDARTIYWYAEQFGIQIRDVDVCIFVYELLWDVACADGWLHPAEKEMLQKICSFLRVPRAYFDINYRRRRTTFVEGDKKEAKRKSQGNGKKKRDWRHPYVSGRSSILEAYEILESESTATVEELKSAYRRMAKRYHPDLLRANGVPEEMIAEATARMVQVNAAWDDIRNSKGI